jgi:hypothetical protein
LPLVIFLPLHFFFLFFFSCSWVVLEGMQASVQVSLPTNQTTVSLEMWQLRQLNEPFLINYIFLPLWLDPAPNSNAFFASARVAQRLQNAHPLINGTTKQENNIDHGGGTRGTGHRMSQRDRSHTLPHVCWLFLFFLIMFRVMQVRSSSTRPGPPSSL